MKKSVPLFVAGAVLLMSGCALTQKSDPSHFYVLPTPSVTDVPSGTTRQVIGIDPVSLPRYLDRPLIVTLTDRGQVKVAAFHRWAEPLEAGFTRVLTESLRTRLPGSLIMPLPARHLALTRRLEIQVHDFQAQDTVCLLKVNWRIIQDGKTIAWYRETIRHPIEDPSDYRAIATAMSQAIDSLAARIVDKLPRAQPQPPPLDLLSP